MTGPYTFSRLQADGLPLVQAWLGRPHVTEWWDDDGEIAELVGAPDGDTVPYVVHLAGRPIAYLQCTTLEPAVRGIDQFIGEEALLGRGHGSAFVRQFCDGLFADEGVAEVTTDPDIANARAIRAYTKAGFTPVGPRDEPWGHVLLMRRERSRT